MCNFHLMLQLKRGQREMKYNKTCEKEKVFLSLVPYIYDWCVSVQQDRNRPTKKTEQKDVLLHFFSSLLSRMNGFFFFSSFASFLLRPKYTDVMR